MKLPHAPDISYAARAKAMNVTGSKAADSGHSLYAFMVQGFELALPQEP
jgi:hypothetical protein